MTHDATVARRFSPGIETAVIVLFWGLLATSGVVLFEPAPFDLAFMAFFGLALICGLRVPGAVTPMIVLSGILLLFSLIGTSQSPGGQYFKDTLRHVGITALLVALAVFIAAFVYRFQGRGLRALMNGWVVAALIAALAGILSYFDLLGGLSEKFVLYGRAKGTFKDPNVLAPFLIPPAIYCLYCAASRSWFWVLVNLGVLMILCIGILLSFSRGGWGHFALSGSVAVVLWLLTVSDNRFRIRLMVLVALATSLLAIALAMLLDTKSVGDLFLQRFAVQDYDSAAFGRFAGQVETVKKILSYPLGLGAFGFLPAWFEQPHNVYLFQFMIGGWGGGFSYIALVLVTLAKSLAFLQRQTPYSAIMVVLFASYFGLAVEGVVVDSDHWRHFWILTGAIWGLCALYAHVPARTSGPVAAPGPMRHRAPAEPLALRSSLE